MSFDMKKMVNVTNRSSGLTIYSIPEYGVRREFQPGETKQVTYDEMVQLSYQPGGRSLMQNFLMIKEPEVTKDLNIHTEPEYFMTEVQVVELLQTGSLDALLDALDFAPSGVIDIIKEKAVSLPLYDMQKREAIEKATGYNVTAAIENAKPDPEDVATENAAPAQRRVKAEEPAAPARRTSGDQYKIVSEG